MRAVVFNILFTCCLCRFIFEYDNFCLGWLCSLNSILRWPWSAHHNTTAPCVFWTGWHAAFAFHTRFWNTSKINSTSRQPWCHSLGSPPCCHFSRCSPKALKVAVLMGSKDRWRHRPTAASRVTYWCLMFPVKVNVVLFHGLPLCVLICCCVSWLLIQPDVKSQFGNFVFEVFRTMLVLF